MTTALYLGGSALAALAATVALFFALSRPHALVYPYLVALFFFPIVGYGSGGEIDIWGRGTGMVFFPLVGWYLWGMAFVAVLSRRGAAQPIEWPLISRWFFAFAALFAGHIIVAAASGESMRDTLSMYGLIGVVNLAIFFWVLLFTLDSDERCRRLGDVLIAFAAARMLYGVVRFVGFGGDPTNAYARLEGLDVTLTFFDIGDSLVAMIGVALAAWRLLDPPAGTTAARRFAYVGTVLIGLVVIVFSYRRSSWVGLVLAGVLFILYTPPKHRMAAVLGGLGTLVAATLSIYVIASRRFADVGSRGLLESLMPDLASVRSSFLSDRERELLYAWQTVLDNPLFGVGAWGRYEGQGIHWQIGEGGYGFVHSGFGHILLKGGFVGLALVLFALGAFVRFWWRVRRDVPAHYRDLFHAGPLALAFMLPTFLIGTPTIEIRTMQLTALALALPYLAYRAAGGRR